MFGQLLAMLCAAGLLAACGGGSRPTPPPPSVVTIPDPVAYLAQSRNPDGNPATPLQAGDPITYRRFDFGHVQASESFLVGPGSAITTWSYAPWGPFVDANGDGGESYELQGNVVRITNTKHLGIPTTPISWVALRADTVDCAQGWTTYSPIERGCRAVVTYPGIGPVDTVISEHRALFMERIFLGRGWGRLAWQTFRSDATPAVDPARCPEFGWNSDDRGETLTDCRYALNVEPSDGSLTGAMLWRP